jgi:hypothetical protein
MCSFQKSQIFRSSGAPELFGSRFYRHLVPPGPGTGPEIVRLSCCEHFRIRTLAAELNRKKRLIVANFHEIRPLFWKNLVNDYLCFISAARAQSSANLSVTRCQPNCWRTVSAACAPRRKANSG